MIAPPIFTSLDAHISRIGDADFWGPYVAEVLARHDLADTDRKPVAGVNATYPTFVCGDVVVKLFGQSPAWRRSFAAEHAAHRLIATDPAIAAPTLLGDGRLFDDNSAPWPYLVTTRMPGIASPRAELSAAQRHALAIDLGRQVRRVHALASSGVATAADWRAGNIAGAAAESSLPPHLVAQVDDYLGRLGPFDTVFVHGDLCANHVFVKDGRLAGIIDWGDAMATDRHYELIQIFRDTFACDKALFAAFLDASDWPMAEDFAQKALGLALHRQAIGLAQHHTMDVFEPIAARFPVQDIATLDELATELFAGQV